MKKGHKFFGLNVQQFHLIRTRLVFKCIPKKKTNNRVFQNFHVDLVNMIKKYHTLARGAVQFQTMIEQL